MPRRLPLLLLLALAPVAHAQTDNPCAIPFTEMSDPRTGKPFTPADAANASPKATDRDNLRQRYLVADLDTRGADGKCKGVQESYPFVQPLSPDTAAFPELADNGTLQNFLASVQSAYEKPAALAPVATVGHRQYCVGQTLSLCELRAGVPTEIARLATSSELMDSTPTLYAPLNEVTLRSWAVDRPYTADDATRDAETGGISKAKASGKNLSHYTGGGGWVMPNFVKWDAVQGFQTRGYMGMHQLTKGESNVVVPGSAVSHGCFRLSRYGAMLNRWWTPFGARLFIRISPGRYRMTP